MSDGRGGKVEAMSHVIWARGDRMNVQTVKPSERQTVIDGERVFIRSRADAEPAVFMVTNQTPTQAANLRSVPGSPEEMLAPFASFGAVEANAIPPFPRTISFSGVVAEGEGRVSADVSFDGEGRVARIDLRDADSGEGARPVSSTFFRGAFEALPGVWLFHRIAAMLTASVLLLGAGCSGKESGLPETSIPEFSIPENVLGEPTDMIPELDPDKYQLPENEGMEFVKNLKLGWNLGNTFDATVTSTVTQENEMDIERAWCGTITSIDNIAAIKAAGFQTIRIPVSWHNHVDPAADYKISEQWMCRVREVVDWARACDLYVILNTHHDNSEEYYYPDAVHMEQSKAHCPRGFLHAGRTQGVCLLTLRRDRTGRDPGPAAGRIQCYLYE